MLSDLENNFVELEKNIVDLQKNYQNLLVKYDFLHQEFENIKEKYENTKKDNQVLAEDYKKIKLHSAISGNPDHNRLMKNHINRLVKEVDFCIAHLQNSGL
jgi:regulator of replication initiation timing